MLCYSIFSRSCFLSRSSDSSKEHCEGAVVCGDVNRGNWRRTLACAVRPQCLAVQETQGLQENATEHTSKR